MATISRIQRMALASPIGAKARTRLPLHLHAASSAGSGSFSVRLTPSPVHSSFKRNKSTAATATSPVNPESSPQSSSKPSFDLEQVRQEILQRWMMEEALTGQASSIRSRYCCFTYEDAKRAYELPSASWHWLDRELSSNLAGETGAVYIYHGALAALSWRERFLHWKMAAAAQFSGHNEDGGEGSAEAALMISAAREFCNEHKATEAHHLWLFQSVLPSNSGNNSGKHTRLLPVWRLAGWTVGFLPTALGGSKALYVTVEAVETFVEEHFQAQIQHLEEKRDKGDESSSGSQTYFSRPTELLALLKYCCEDEVHHKEDAARRLLMLHNPDGYLKSSRHNIEGIQNNFTTIDISSVEEKLESFWWVSPWRRLVHFGSSTAAEIARRI